MAEFIGPPRANGKRDRLPPRQKTGVLSEVDGDAESKALKVLLASLSLLDEKDQNVYYGLFNDTIKLNVINEDENLAKIKASEVAAEKLGIKESIPVNLDDKTLFKVALDTKNKLPNDIRLKIDTNANLIGDKELEMAELTAGNLGINFDGETAVGQYNYNKGKLSINPRITRTDENIKTDTNLQYLLDEDTVDIFTPQGQSIPIPKESITVNINTDKLYDQGTGTISYVKRKDDGDEKASVFLENYLANENELGGAENQAQLSFNYITDKGIKFSGKTYKDFERDQDKSSIGVNLPITDFASLEGKKFFDDAKEDDQFRLNIGKNINFPGGGKLNLGGFYDQDGDYQAGINYKLAFGQEPEPKGPTFSTTDPKEALSFLQRNILQGRYKKGGRVKMSSGGLADILKV
jgi:hypothetical protein